MKQEIKMRRSFQKKQQIFVPPKFCNSWKLRCKSTAEKLLCGPGFAGVATLIHTI